MFWLKRSTPVTRRAAQRAKLKLLAILLVLALSLTLPVFLLARLAYLQLRAEKLFQYTRWANEVVSRIENQLPPSPTTLLTPELFAMMKSEFEQNPVSARGFLTVRLGKATLAEFSPLPSPRLPKPPRLTGQDIVLADHSLPKPFSNIALLIQAPSLPLAAGARTVGTIVCAVLFIIPLCLIWLYQLAAKQIDFAHERGEFLAAVTHELKTPLTSIRMYSELLKEGWVQEASKAKSYYDFIFREAERLSRLIGDILSMTQLVRDKTKVALISRTGQELLDIAHEAMTPLAHEQRFEVRITPAPAEEALLAVVQVNVDAFIRIIINVTENAIKFLSQLDRRQLDLSIQVREQCLVLSLRDYGPGVEPKRLKKVFKLFYRGEDEITRSTSGAGIGLSLVESLAEKMSAQVTLENSHPGCTFELKLRIVDHFRK